MKSNDQTSVTEFVLSGLSSNPNLQLPLFLLCLSVYLVTLLGNLTIIALITVTPGLQSPMYFFLMNLSSLDILYSSTITPNIMDNILSVNKTIRFTNCATQMFFFIDFVTSEGILLAVMAYDRYVAICKPLYYTTLINKARCYQLICLVYAAAFISSFSQTYITFTLPFCGPNHIHHFYCDINPILKLSCKDTFLNEMILIVFAACIEVSTFLFILISYVHILLQIYRIGISRGKSKSLSTCASHFTCVCLFYCPALFMYLRPTSAFSVNQDWVLSLFYTVIIPMLNPIIYSLRNQDVKQAAAKLSINNVFTLFSLHERHW